jgi:hypothetical protein
MCARSASHAAPVGSHGRMARGLAAPGLVVLPMTATLPVCPDSHIVCMIAI